jgi:hypothetical protein
MQQQQQQLANAGGSVGAGAGVVAFPAFTLPSMMNPQVAAAFSMPLGEMARQLEQSDGLFNRRDAATPENAQSTVVRLQAILNAVSRTV